MKVISNKSLTVNLVHQNGAVLIVGLVLLLMMTIVGLAAVRGTNMQEIMAGNMRDRNLAFQSAESGLRTAESTINTLINNPFTGNGLWRDLNLTAASRPSIYQWTAATWTTAGNAIEVVDSSLNVPNSNPTNPLYIIEKVVTPVGAAAAADGSGVGKGSQDVAPPPDYFRVTSRGTGTSGVSEVILQSTFKTYF